MGVTGSGKSTFISHFCPEAAVGHTLESCRSPPELGVEQACANIAVFLGPGTRNVAIYHYPRRDGVSVYLVDTPGFDDTYKTDTDILRDISDWLNRSYETRVLLSGIIYLHRISDARVGGSSMQNLRMFKKLVGEDNLSNIVLASTMWGMVPDLNVAVAREAELQNKDDFWGQMIKNGSRVFRQDRGAESAAEIRDMVDRSLSLDQTAAGKEVQGEMAKQRAEYEKRVANVREEMHEAIRNQDKEHQTELENLQKELGAKLRSNEDAIERLKSGKDEIRREMEAKWEEERQALTRRFEAQQAAREREQKAREEEERRALIRQFEAQQAARKEERQSLVRQQKAQQAAREEERRRKEEFQRHMQEELFRHLIYTNPLLHSRTAKIQLVLSLGGAIGAG
ncbi:hypothetical protein B0T26DRAFT_747848 [Lasiosphaeria miniovina]|uniref:G domain-containing protein n=1 Tax=Lasiosphaeria miniovina TaxID=1954250 RepID=A0AA40E852_9PEZI|nr:uncharacterized protein B0T26DRAFT_747848 [Lasiosphaeria miniovina]KAK0727536.1 hypothetical protein B0T26DRAFT_747848 [Lasiosphaeria miniovina]